MSVTDWSKAINLLYQQPLHNLKSTTLTLTHLCWHDKIRVGCLLLAIGSGKLHWFSNLFLTNAQPTFSCYQTLSHLNCECCCSGHLTRMCCLHGDLSWNWTFHVVLLYRFYSLISWHSYTLLGFYRGRGFLCELSDMYLCTLWTLMLLIGCCLATKSLDFNDTKWNGWMW